MEDKQGAEQHILIGVVQLVEGLRAHGVGGAEEENRNNHEGSAQHTLISVV